MTAAKTYKESSLFTRQSGSNYLLGNSVVRMADNSLAGHAVSSNV